MIEQKIIAISGASGFIGKNLSAYFKKRGYHITPLSRELFEDRSTDKLQSILSDAHIVINLAGANLLHPWTKKYKKELYDSRILTTRRIVNTINKSLRKPSLFISASAVGYYPSEGCYDEYNQENGKSFLAGICKAWEIEASKISSDVRLAITRFGIVLAPKGGAFEKMALPAKWGFPTVLGKGDQYFSWIDIADLVRAYDFIITHNSLKGPINLTSPYHLSNREFTNALGEHYKKFFTPRIPDAILKIALGEASRFIADGECAIPSKLIDNGFGFESPTIYKFLEKLDK